MIRRQLMCYLLCLVAVPAAVAERVVYKITGPDGKVSYTDHPPAVLAGETLETLALVAGPDEAEVAAARERVQEELAFSRETTDRMAADRRAREEAQREAERAREERAWREAMLQAAQQSGQSDQVEWVWPAYGYRYRPPYGHRPPYPGYPGKPHPPVKPEPRQPVSGSGSGGMSMPDLINRSRPWY